MPKRKASDDAFAEAQESVSDEASGSSSGKSSTIAPISKATSKKSKKAQQVRIIQPLSYSHYLISLSCKQNDDPQKPKKLKADSKTMSNDSNPVCPYHSFELLKWYLTNLGT